VALVTVVLVAGGVLRLYGSNWDQGRHLHPDERYVSEVANNIRWPGGIGEYFNVAKSPLSPYNIEQSQNYIYGTLPLFSTKLIAGALGQGDYGRLNIVGRRLAGLLDMLTAVLVFLIARLVLEQLGRRRAVEGALLAAALYAFTVTAIQHAHFFTTDTWLAFFGMLTFLLALKAVRMDVDPGSRSPSPLVLLVGASLGLTVACKLSGALITVPVLIALAGRAVVIAGWAGARRALVRLAAETGLVALCGYIAFRIVSPYTFASSNWLDVSLNHSFRDALAAQARATAGEGISPPSYQWMVSPRVWSPLENLVVWQLGIPLGIAALAGAGLLLWHVLKAALAWWRTRAVRPTTATVVAVTSQLMLLSFAGLVFFYVGTRFAHSGRYLLPIVPLLPIAAAYGLAVITRGHRRIWLAAAAVLVVTTALYAVAFDHIYSRPNTRVAATEWIESHIPGGASIANEHWDDAIPVGGRWIDPNTGQGVPRAYRGITVPVFDPDDQDKLRKLYDALSRADYYAVTSPRAWNTIGRLPDRFPLMTRFYKELFAQRLGFVPAKRFTSYPELLGVHVDDLRAEEAFWVYDHPPVTVFRRVGPLRWETFRASLCPQRVPPYCA
jgi:Dolichyl-phosphate-mannose-protein mannosyltransferase